MLTACKTYSNVHLSIKVASKFCEQFIETRVKRFTQAMLGSYYSYDVMHRHEYIGGFKVMMLLHNYRP